MFNFFTPIQYNNVCKAAAVQGERGLRGRRDGPWALHLLSSFHYWPCQCGRDKGSVIEVLCHVRHGVRCTAISINCMTEALL
jgi:hypothetical protein